MYRGSEFFHPGSLVKKIPVSGSAARNLSILTQKIVSKLRKYDPGCSSQSRITDLVFLPVPDLGSRGQKGNRNPDTDPQHWFLTRITATMDEEDS